VQIGEQCWFAENLRSENYRNSDEIRNVQDDERWRKAVEGMTCAFDNNDSKAEFFGQLYNGYVVEDEHGLCPWGWHVPVDAEWNDLVAFLSEDAIGAEVEGWNGMADWEEGQMLKSSCCWMPQNLSSVPGLSAEDAHGFNALPGGERGFDGFFPLQETTVQGNGGARR